MGTIPASAIVNITPNVVGAGGTALDLNGLLLSTSARVPIGEVLSFASEADASDYFGPSAAETKLSAIYFNGFDNSNKKPGSIIFAQYPASAVAAYLRGGSMAAVTLAELKAFPSGTITISVNGTPETSGSIVLSSATSFSNAAAIIQTAFTAPSFTVTFDSVAEAFVFTATATGATSTIAFPTTAALTTDLKLTQATGAVLSQGADAATPGAFMDSIVALTQNWATFMLAFDPDSGSGNTNKLAFATWTAQQNNRYAFVCWDTDITPTESTDAATSLGQLLKASNSSGTCLIWQPTTSTDGLDGAKAAFICGAAASIDFDERNGRITFAFKSQSGLFADVTDETVADNLIANGYNFYGAYATANDQFIWFYPGSVSGEFLWLDSYIDEIWFNNALQLALMSLLQNTKSIPYNPAGYALMDAACQDPINAALNFGAIRPNVSLSAAQAAEVNAAAGTKIDGVLSTVGYYLQILTASAQVRAARGSPPAKLWYVDGQSIQSIDLTSIEVA